MFYYETFSWTDQGKCLKSIFLNFGRQTSAEMKNYVWSMILKAFYIFDIYLTGNLLKPENWRDNETRSIWNAVFVFVEKSIL